MCVNPYTQIRVSGHKLVVAGTIFRHIPGNHGPMTFNVCTNCHKVIHNGEDLNIKEFVERKKNIGRVSLNGTGKNALQELKKYLHNEKKRSQERFEFSLAF